MSRSNLQRRLDQVSTAVRDLPRVAAAELAAVVAQSEREHRTPEGEAWPPTKDGAPFDPAHHISYQPVVNGDHVALVGEHPAERYARLGTRNMPARRKVPRVLPPRVLKALRERLRRAG